MQAPDIKDRSFRMLRYKVAIIDLGSNTTKCSIAECSGKRIRLIDERIAYNRLGEGLTRSGVLSLTAMQRTLDTIHDLLNHISQHQATHIWITGTMALRTANNAGEFADLIRRETGLVPDILDAQTEAMYSYLAATSSEGMTDGNALVFDIGGGSTELTGKDMDGSLHTCSTDLGVITLTESFSAHDRITAQELQRMMDHAQTQLRQYLPFPRATGAVGLGGSVHALRDMLMKEEHDHGIGLAEMMSLMSRLSGMTLDQRREIHGLAPQRADVIVAGLVIIHAILKLQSLDRFTVCPWGMRHGMLLSRTGCKTIIRGEL